MIGDPRPWRESIDGRIEWFHAINRDSYSFVGYTSGVSISLVAVEGSVYRTELTYARTTFTLNADYECFIRRARDRGPDIRITYTVYFILSEAKTLLHGFVLSRNESIVSWVLRLTELTKNRTGGICSINFSGKPRSQVCDDEGPAE